MSHIKHKDQDYVENETDDFIAEIKKSSDFIQLAGNPLLLSILISQRFKYSVLPKNKIKALTTITEHLINHHPIRRRTSANIVEEEDLDFEISEVFSVLAIHIQKECHDGVITKIEAKKVIEKYLVDFLDYESPRAKKLSKNLLDIGANNIGIIIEKSAEEVAFMHRQFQEFMAAKYLYESDKSISEEYIKLYGHNPQWNQVVTFFFGLIPHMRQKDFDFFISLLKIGTDKRLSYSHFLKYSLVLTLNNAPVNTAKKYLKEVTSKFEFEADSSNKSILWNIMLDSIFNNKLRPEVLEFFFRYFPNNYKFNDYRLKSLRTLSTNQLTQPIKEYLLKSLINGNHYQKIDASYTIQNFISDNWLYNEIQKILDNCSNPEVLSYSINTIITDKIELETKKKYFEKLKDTEHSKIFLFILKLKIDLKLQTDDDLDLFVKSLQNFDYTLSDEVQTIFIDGWSESKKLLSISLQSVNRHHRGNLIDSKIAWRILFHCFNMEESVIEKVVEELKNEEYPFISMDAHRGWPYIANYFRDNKKLIPEIEVWINKQQFSEPEIAYACLVGRTENNKRYLLNNLPKSGVPHWYVMALIEGWPNDSKVNQELKDYFKGDSRNSFYAAHYISEVFKDDKKEGITILENFLFNREIYIRDRAVLPLIELDKKYFKDNILEKFLTNELNYIDKGDFGQYYNALIPIVDNFHELDIVKELVENKLCNDSNILATLIKNYPDLIENIEKQVCLSHPLRMDLRLKLVELLGNKNILNEVVLRQLSEYPNEEEEIIRATAAINYFTFLKTDFSDKIIELCKENVFYRGHDVDVQRQIAFCGYLITRKLSDYYQLKDKSLNDVPNPRFSFNTSYKEMSPVMVKLLIKNFDYLISEIGDDFNSLSNYENKDSQSVWGFWAKYSDRHSQTYPHILNFIKSNIDTIKNQNLIDFLKRTSSQGTLLKSILLRIINNDKDNIAQYCGRVLGENYKNDFEVYNTVSQINNPFNDVGKIMAMCYGWPNDKKLKEIFEEIVKNEFQINSNLAYNLKFIFRDVENILKFFDAIFENYNQAKYEYNSFINPLYRRLVNDSDLQKEIKARLLVSSTTTEKISYYSILNSINKIDEEVLSWKSIQLLQVSTNTYGYNIMTNRISSILEILDEVIY